ncbi:uncharacterized protein LOC109716212 [Ananas comosus]|uniref:Uncharacterized protein LOC109716212 n=1 Tax=Ananas comosus TaxID=4615 RepID=A0A6P5FLF0_ANACO|nr:uncharacterized protein LOC109716212 [Ananas comosus]
MADGDWTAGAPIREGRSLSEGGPSTRWPMAGGSWWRGGVGLAHAASAQVQGATVAGRWPGERRGGGVQLSEDEGRRWRRLGVRMTPARPETAPGGRRVLWRRPGAYGDGGAGDEGGRRRLRRAGAARGPRASLGSAGANLSWLRVAQAATAARADGGDSIGGQATAE